MNSFNESTHRAIFDLSSHIIITRTRLLSWSERLYIDFGYPPPLYLTASWYNQCWKVTLPAVCSETRNHGNGRRCEQQRRKRRVRFQLFDSDQIRSGRTEESSVCHRRSDTTVGQHTDSSESRQFGREEGGNRQIVSIQCKQLIVDNNHIRYS